MKKKINGWISVLLVLSMICGLFPGSFSRVKAVAPIEALDIKGFSENTATGKDDLVIGWISDRMVTTVTAVYSSGGTTPINLVDVKRLPGTGNQYLYEAKLNTVRFDADNIYEITFFMHDANGEFANGTINFMKGISFTGDRKDLLEEGVKESGTKPEVLLKWNRPKVWNSASGKFEPISGSVNERYIITVSKKPDGLSGADGNVGIIIDKDASSGQYQARLSTVGSTPVNVTATAGGEQLGFSLIGKKDENDNVTSDVANGKLLWNEMRPGTKYYMMIEPDASYTVNGRPVILRSGSPEWNILDDLSWQPYTHTPIRFEIEKDAVGNIYTKLYEMNRDSAAQDETRLNYYILEAMDIGDTQTPPPLTLKELQDWQVGTSNIGKWKILFEIPDDVFRSNKTDYAATIIEERDTNQRIFYKVLARSNKIGDFYESQTLQYVISKDTAKPPIPIDVKTEIVKTPNYGTVTDPETGGVLKDKYDADHDGNTDEELTVKGTDVRVTWHKPKNWDSMNKNNLYFHFMLNTNPLNMNMDYGLFPGSGLFRLNYRWIKSVRADEVTVVKVNVNGKDEERLEYRLDGRKLFTYSFGNIWNPGNYPTYLLNNKTYFLQVVTTIDAGPTEFGSVDDINKDHVVNNLDMQEIIKDGNNLSLVSFPSVTASFTTLPEDEKNVPIPAGFELSSEKIDENTKKTSLVELKFNGIDIDWSIFTQPDSANSYDGNHVYYDLYMSSTGNDWDQLQPVYSTQTGTAAGAGVNIVHEMKNGQTNGEGGQYTLRLSGLRTNTKYYFKLRSRLVFKDPLKEDMPSDFTATVPVTTSKAEVENPDPGQRKLIAPKDFKEEQREEATATTGPSVTFKWTRTEPDVDYYNLICTSSKDLTSYENDYLYRSFVDFFGTNGKLQLDPKEAHDYRKEPWEKFTYEELVSAFRYRVEAWLKPNTVYYFSLRTEKIVKDAAGNEVLIYSDWITIPVTTTLIEAPTRLEAVNDVQLGFDWTDTDASTRAEDYQLYIKESGEATYRAVSYPKATVVKGLENRYYGRINGLKANTSYDIKAVKGQNAASMQTMATWRLTTRDEYHQLEVRWIGYPGYEYELEIRPEGEEQYTILTSGDMEIRKEKDKDTLSMTGYYRYYAKIKSAPVQRTGGTPQSVPLKSNMKYYIRVRAVVSTNNTSKYDGPVTARTQFKQGDQDDKEEEEDTKAKFLNRIQELEKKLYWRVDMDETSNNRVLLKGSRVLDALKNSRRGSLTVDISDIAAAYSQDNIYIPASVILALEKEGSMLTLKTKGAEYIFRPDTLNLEDAELVKKIKENKKINDIFLRITIVRTQYGAETLPAAIETVSDVNDLKLDVLGSTKTNPKLEEEIHNKVYNAETGLVKQKMKAIEELFQNGSISWTDKGDTFIQSLLKQVEQELSLYIGDIIVKEKYSSSIMEETRVVEDFDAPLQIRLICREKEGFKTPYVSFGSVYSWNKLTAGFGTEGSITSISALKPGRYVVTAQREFAVDVPSTHWAVQAVKEFTAAYDISDIFGSSGAFAPDTSVTMKESILLYEKVAGMTEKNAGMDLRQKAKSLGLEGIISANTPLKDVTRQESASILIRLYCQKEGLDAGQLTAKRQIHLSDEKSIKEKYFNDVILAIDFEIFSLPEGNRFEPNSYVTRAEIVTALVRLLKLTGDL